MPANRLVTCVLGERLRDAGRHADAFEIDRRVVAPVLFDGEVAMRHADRGQLPGDARRRRSTGLALAHEFDEVVRLHRERIEPAP